MVLHCAHLQIHAIIMAAVQNSTLAVAPGCPQVLNDEARTAWYQQVFGLTKVITNERDMSYKTEFISSHAHAHGGIMSILDSPHTA